MRIAIVTILLLAVCGAFSCACADVNVTQHHNHYTRDGLYVDPAFTYASASNLVRDLNFNGAISGEVYAQPLYIEGGPGGRAMVIAVTTSNNVYALDAANGSVIWQDHVGTPVLRSQMPCGNIDSYGIIGTPVVDLPSRTLFLDAMTRPTTGTTNRHLIYALNVDTGATNAGWPVDVNATAHLATTNFVSTAQGERGALTVLGTNLYVPFGGLAGDCGTYHGWIVDVPLVQPTNVTAWCTGGNEAGAWAVGGVASDDGLHPFIATGNSGVAANWSGGEAVFRFQPGAIFSGLTNDYWAPTNWLTLDEYDLDIGGCGPLIVDAPGATPPQLVVSLGKDGNAYLLNRTNLGGVSVPLAKASLLGIMIEAAATYRTTQGTYVAFTTSSKVAAFRIGAANPPTVSMIWNVSLSGRGSPFVTSTDGTNNTIVWVIGSEGDQRLHGYNGDTGATIFNGGGANELMTGTRRFNTGIAARGRIYIANDSRVYAFTVPVPPIILNNLTVAANGSFQFNFTNTPGLSFTVYSATNLSTPFTNWIRTGVATETAPGQFQFTNPPPANVQEYFRVTSP